MATTKKKTKFVNLFSNEGQAKMTMKLPGRNSCECQASKHKLVGNCLKCGRVVCEQEGSGPCFYCGNLVCNRDEKQKIQSNTVEGNTLKNELMNRKWREQDQQTSNILDDQEFSLNDIAKAVAHKNKLIEFDRTSAQRTRVIDDAADYFDSNNKWLSSEQRSKLIKLEKQIQEKKQSSNKKFTIDFAGRRIINELEYPNDDIYNEARSVQENAHYKLKADREMEEQQQLELLKMIDWEEHEILNRNLPGNFTAPQWVEKNPKTVSVCSNVSVEDRDRQRLRIQDKDLMEMYDDGQCLTMHQPWASLLVRGIKMHEGRTWHTAHRGRLWIHAAAKEPDTQTIYDMETFYRQRENGDQIDFPSEYPTSMLLGCVELVDCLERDTYTEKFPKGESDSDYVFICKNPQELFFKLPMKGQHKIFKLDPQVHQTAKKVLLRRTANTA